MNPTVRKYSTRKQAFVQHSLGSLAMLVALLVVPGLLQAAVTATLERDTIYAGDTVTLRITATGNQQGEQPDLTPLQKDFEVLGTSSSRRLQIINGQRSDKDEWLIELAPLRNGTLSIPPLSVRNSVTPALTVKVKEQPAASTAQAGQPVFVTAEINPSEGDTYVQQQILYTTRLYYRVPLTEGSLSDPRIENAVVERLGKDQQYETKIDERSYQVVERRYAIFPEHSGELSIGATVFTGRMVSKTGQRSRFSSMDSLMERMLSQSGLGDSLVAGKRIRLRSDELTLDIKPRPDSYAATHWLPSQQLVVRDSWAESPPAIRVGEPVTRTLTLEAKGLEASQLPDLDPPVSGTLRVYPEQAELTNRSDGNWIYGRSEQRFTYVAAQPGKLELPEVRIDWWDSINDKPQTAVLPAWEIMVEAGTGEPATASTGNQTETTATDPPVQFSDTRDKVIPVQHAPQESLYWMIGGGLVALAILVAIKRVRRRRPAVPGIPGTTPSTTGTIDNITLAHARGALQGACTRGDAQTAARALLDWAAATWPHQPPRSLGALAGRVDRGANAIRELERALYSTDNNSWSGQPLWKAYMHGLQTAEKSTDTGPARNSAPPLYPDWNQKIG